MDTQQQAWPREPYKGLAPYAENDSLIFTGRTRDKQLCAQMLSKASTKALLLHGPTGCGKSSFLRASLIPYLEGRAYPLRFVRYDQTEQRPVFVRATGEPIARIAEAIFEFCSRPYRVQTVSGVDQIDLADVPKPNSVDAFILSSQQDPELLVAALHEIAFRVPHKVVLVVDQGEEVITLNDTSPNGNLEGFLKFLQFAALGDVGVKLLVSMRTEYLGRFATLLTNTEGFRCYFLDNLPAEVLPEIIEHPTSTKKTEAGSAKEQYRFRYAEGVARRIVRDLLSSPPVGAVLPVLQIICSRLYRHTKRRKRKAHFWTISLSDYFEVGAGGRQIDEYVDESLLWSPHRVSARSTVHIEQWRRTLVNLVTTQPDGSVTTKMLPANKLEAAARQNGCSHAKETIDELVAGERAILLRTPSASPSTHGDAQISLRHDAVGVALAKWKNSLDTSAPNTAVETLSRFRLASELSKGDLFGDCTPINYQLNTLNDLVWDHMLPIYADRRRFGARLGLDITVSPSLDLSRDAALSFHDLVKRVVKESDDDSRTVITVPWELFSEFPRDEWTAIAVSNVYTGYALVGPQADGICALRDCGDNGLVEMFRMQMQLFSDGRDVWVFEKFAKRFVEFVKELAQDLAVRDLSVKVQHGDAAITRRTRRIIRKMMVDRPDDFIVPTAPSRAFVERAGYVVYIDVDDVVHLINSVFSDDEQRKAEWFARLKEIYPLNIWLVDVPWPEKDHHRELLLRLGALAFFTSEQIRTFTEDFVRFIYSENLELSERCFTSVPLDRESIRNAVATSYLFSGFDDYEILFLDPDSDYSVRVLGEKEIEQYCWVYGEVISLRHECHRHMEDISKLQSRHGELPQAALNEVRRLKSKGWNNYQILNFYDAEQMLGRAARILRGS